QAKDEQGKPIGGFNFEPWPLWQCYVAASTSKGRVDTIHRQWCPTVEQAVAESGLDAMSEATQRKFNDGKLSETINMTWAIYPNREGKKGILS
ncbi:portal protein, partial [Acinetobacter baumannii]